MAKKNDQHLTPRILSVKVAKDHLKVLWEDTVIEAGSGKSVRNEVEKKFRHEPHEDLANELKKMAPHLAFLTEYESQATMERFEAMDDAEVEELSSRYAVRTVLFRHKDSGDTLQLGGYRVLRSKRVSNVLASPVRFQSEAEEYPYADHLEEIADDLRKEVVEYMAGKRASEGQITMGFAKAENAAGGEGGEEGEGGED